MDDEDATGVLSELKRRMASGRMRMDLEQAPLMRMEISQDDAVGNGMRCCCCITWRSITYLWSGCSGRWVRMWPGGRMSC